MDFFLDNFKRHTSFCTFCRYKYLSPSDEGMHVFNKCTTMQNFTLNKMLLIQIKHFYRIQNREYEI